jgi:1,4-alpha-glucan branching enzyme
MNNTIPEPGPGMPREMDGNFALLTEDDLHWFNEGTHCRVYEKMGAHLVEHEGVAGVCFSVWAPNAEQVYVVGDFNGWDKSRHPLRLLGGSGVWSGFIPGLERGATYKYHIRSRHEGFAVEYGGSGQGNQGGGEASPLGWHFKPHSFHITLPPLGAVFFKHQGARA